MNNVKQNNNIIPTKSKDYFLIYRTARMVYSSHHIFKLLFYIQILVLKKQL